MTEKALRELLQLLSQKGEPVKPFEIRSYGKSELAMLYFPDAKTKKGAMNNLNYWINYCSEPHKTAQLPPLKCCTFALSKENLRDLILELFRFKCRKC